MWKQQMLFYAANGEISASYQIFMVEFIWEFLQQKKNSCSAYRNSIESFKSFAKRLESQEMVIG